MCTRKKTVLKKKNFRFFARIDSVTQFWLPLKRRLYESQNYAYLSGNAVLGRMKIITTIKLQILVKSGQTKPFSLHSVISETQFWLL